MTHQTNVTGPRGTFLMGNLGEFRNDLLGFLDRCAGEHGDYVPFRLGHRRCVLLCDPKLIEQVLVTDNDKYIKHFGLRINRQVLGNGLLLNEGKPWRARRRLSAPAFQPQRIHSYARIMSANIQRMLTDWTHGQTRDIYADMSRLTLDIAAQTLFGADIASDSESISRALDTAMTTFVARFNALIPLPGWIPSPTNRRIKRAVAHLDRIVGQLIDQRRRIGPGSDDLISSLLEAQAQAGHRVSDRQLLDEAKTMLLAGHETTAVTLSWMIYLLSQHPQVRQELRRELNLVLGGRTATCADLPRLKYTEQVLLEVLRLYPASYLIGRQATENTAIGRHPCPKGTTVFVSQWVTHRDSRFFDDPLSFAPQRWEDGLIKKLPRCTYFPFGAGPRICIGSSFAMAESILVLAAVASHCDFELIGTSQVQAWPALTLRPRDSIKVKIDRIDQNQDRVQMVTKSSPQGLNGQYNDAIMGVAAGPQPG